MTFVPLVYIYRQQWLARTHRKSDQHSYRQLFISRRSNTLLVKINKLVIVRAFAFDILYKCRRARPLEHGEL